MTLEEFKAKYEGKPIDFDGWYGPQCVDEMNQYLVDVLGFLNPIQLFPGTTAYEIYQNATDPQFDKIANTPTGVPQPGDIVFWDTSIGSAGHVAIFLSGDTNSFTSLDQNWPTGSTVHEQRHNYNGVCGWLHFKGQADALAACMADRAKFWQERDAALSKLEIAKDTIDQLTTKLETVENAFDDYEKTHPDITVSTNPSPEVKIAVTTPQVPEVNQKLQASVEQAKQATKFSILDWLRKLIGL